MLPTLQNKYNSLNNNQKRIYLFCFILIIGMLAGLGICVGNIFLGKPMWPFGTIVFSRDRFGDFFITSQTAQYIGTLYDVARSGGQYFPLTYLLLSPFLLLGIGVGLFAYLSVFVGFYCFYTYKNIIGSRLEKFWFCAVCLLCSYPALYLLDRANTEIFVFILTALFISAYTKGKNKTAAFFLAAAINVKLFPAVLVFLLLKDKNRTALIWTFLFGLILLGAGFLYTGFNAGGLFNNLGFFGYYAQNYPLGLIFGHSLFNIVRVPLLLGVDHTSPFLYGFAAGSGALQPYYAVLVLLLFAFVALYVVFVGKEYWKNMLLLFLCMVGLPYVSQDYTLVHLIIPTIFFLNAKDKMPPHTAIAVTILLALLFIPMNWWTVPVANMHLKITAVWCYPVTPGLILRPLIILFLIFYLMDGEYTFPALKKGIKNYFQK